MKKINRIVRGLVCWVIIIVNLWSFEFRSILKPLIDNPPIEMRVQLINVHLIFFSLFLIILSDLFHLSVIGIIQIVLIMILLLLILSFIKLFNHCGIIFFSFTAALLPHPPNFSETVLHRVNHLLSHLLRHSELIVLLAVFMQQKFLFLFDLSLHLFAH